MDQTWKQTCLIPRHKPVFKNGTFKTFSITPNGHDISNDKIVESDKESITTKTYPSPSKDN